MQQEKNIQNVLNLFTKIIQLWQTMTLTRSRMMKAALQQKAILTTINFNVITAEIGRRANPILIRSAEKYALFVLNDAKIAQLRRMDTPVRNVKQIRF